MSVPQGVYQSMFRPKLDLILNWSFLMNRSDFVNSKNCKLVVSSKFAGSEWVPLTATPIDLLAKNLPFYQEIVVVDCSPEMAQFIRFQILNPETKKGFLLQPIEFELAKLVKSPGSKLAFEFPDSNPTEPDIVVVGVWRTKDEYLYHTELSITNLKSPNWVSDTDPYIKILKYIQTGPKIPENITQTASQDWTVVHFTEYKVNELNPQFKEFVLPSGFGNNNNLEWPLKAEVWCWNASEHWLMGTCYFTIKQLVDQYRSYELMNQSKANVGTLNIKTFRAERNYDILDYFQSGLQINTVMLVDFSESNGDPKKQDSLHAVEEVSKGSKSTYQLVLDSISPTLFWYDFDHTIPLFGMAAKFPVLRIDEQKDFFRVIGRSESQRVPGSPEMLTHFYKSVFAYLSGCEPTKLRPAIDAMNDWTANQITLKQYMYSLLVVFTDGLIGDFEDCIPSLIKSCELPISIIIIGVGVSNFEDFEKYKSGTGEWRLQDKKGTTMNRDMLQMINFFKSAHPIEVCNKMMGTLSNQIMNYYQSRGIFPHLIAGK